MLSAAENELLTRTGKDTPGGQYFRRFWMPALLSEEIPSADCPPVRVKLMGENLIAFRDTGGKIGFVGAYCMHRQMDLFFGRNEETAFGASITAGNLTSAEIALTCRPRPI